jgi:colicin import membrane protein
MPPSPYRGGGIVPSDGDLDYNPHPPIFPNPKVPDVDQAQLELQLKVWKELAISKQVMMRGAAEALKLDPNCSHDELKDALEAVLKKIAATEASVAETREQAKQQVSTLERKLGTTAKAQSMAEAQAAGLLKAQENTAQEIAVERAAAATELKKVKDRLAEREKEIKAINTALSDTPENVLKKMNALKKEKRVEADLRKQEETTANTLRADKRKLEQQVADLKKNTTTLVTRYKDLHEVSLKLHEQLKASAEDASKLPSVPDLDTKLLEEIEQEDSEAKKKK